MSNPDDLGCLWRSPVLMHRLHFVIQKSLEPRTKWCARGDTSLSHALATLASQNPRF